MRKFSIELSIGYKRKKKIYKKKKILTRSNVQAKIKYIDITSISLGKREEGPITIEPGVERR